MLAITIFSMLASKILAMSIMVVILAIMALWGITDRHHFLYLLGNNHDNMLLKQYI